MLSFTCHSPRLGCIADPSKNLIWSLQPRARRKRVSSFRKVLPERSNSLISFHPPAQRGRAVDLLKDTMKISARNKLTGKIVEVKKGATTTHVRIDIGGAVVTASITNEAADELKLATGQAAYAVIKASDVMVGVD